MGFTWKKKDIKLLLSLYLKHKKEFDGRQKQNSKIWQQIVLELQECGVKTNYISLDRKFRNMKRTYFNIKKRPNPSSWEYFDLMEEILNEERPHRMTPTKKNPKIEPPEEPEVCVPEIIMNESNFEQKFVNIESPFMSLDEELELQRIEELRGIRIALEESNRIQRERNQLLLDRNTLMAQFLAVIPKTN